MAPKYLRLMDAKDDIVAEHQAIPFGSSQIFGQAMLHSIHLLTSAATKYSEIVQLEY